MSTIIAISNQKGGVSKTVTSFNLGACLAINHEKKVLLADIDPQANLSEYLGYEPDGKPTMTQLIMTACMGNAVSAEIVKTAVNPKISYLGILPTMVDRTKVSQNALQTLSEKYDSKILNTYISKSVEAAKSTETGIPLCLTGSKLGIEYKKLTTEVLKKC